VWREEFQPTAGPCAGWSLKCWCHLDKKEKKKKEKTQNLYPEKYCEWKDEGQKNKGDGPEEHKPEEFSMEKASKIFKKKK